MTAPTLPTTERELMQRLVLERWIMLTMDTEVDPTTGIGYTAASETWDELCAQLAYIASRLAGDGFEGEPDTRTVVEKLMGTIADKLCAFAVDHRLGTAGSDRGESAA